MDKAAVYARVSTAEQAEKGYSLETQLAACRARAAEQGAAAVEEFIDDGYSGEFIDRPALARLRTAVAEFRWVIVYDPDRLARNLAHQLLVTEEIETAGAALLFVSVSFEQSPEGKLFYSIRGAIAAYEKEKIKERSLRGKRGKVATGKIIADAKPFGYRFDAAISNYAVYEPEAAVVRQMFRWVVEDRVGTAMVAKRLNEQGLLSPRSKKPWIVSTVYRILTNPLYKGTHLAMRYQYQKVAQNKRIKVPRPENEWVEVPVPPIVEAEYWEKAQRQIRSNRSTASRTLKHDQLLNGLVYCALCGRKMTIAYAGKAEEPRSYYICVSQRSNTYLYSASSRCPARRVPTELLDQAVYDHLLQLSHKPQLIERYLAARSATSIARNTTGALGRLQDQAARLAGEREKVLRWFRQQMISDTEAEQQLADIRGRLEEVEQTISKLQAELDNDASTLSAAEIAAAIRANFPAGVPSLADKREAVRSVLEKVVVQRTDTSRGRASQPDLRIELKFL